MPLPSTVSPPVPPIAPEKVPVPDVSVSVLPPSVTVPEPESVVIDSPPLAAEISNVPPLSTTPLDEAIAPAPDSASVSPEPMVVAPV